MNATLKYLFLFVLTLPSWSLFGQSDFRIKEIGTPFIENYLPEDYGAHSQIWAISEDSTGLLTFGTQSGLVQFDGAKWSIVGNKINLSYRSTLPYKDGRLYYGHTQGLGFLEKSDSFSYYNHELQDSLLNPPEGKISKIIEQDGLIIFEDYTRLYFFDPVSTKISTLEVGKPCMIKRLGNRVFILIYKEGLYELNGTELTLLPGTESIANYNIHEISQFSETELLLTSRTTGLYRYDFNEIYKWEVPIYNEIKLSRINSVIGIENLYTSFSTLTNGLFIIDHSGNLIQKFDENVGLNSDVVYDQFLSKDKSLWLGTQNGISHILINSGLSVLDKRHGLLETVLRIKEHNNILYIGTHNGVFAKPLSTPWQKEPVFEKVNGTSESVWWLETVDNKLYSAGGAGLFEIEGKTSTNILPRALCYIQKLDDQNMMVMGGRGRYNQYLLRKNEHEWVYEKEIVGFDDYADRIIKAADGKYWLSNREKGVFSFRYSNDYDSVFNIQKYGKAEGIPSSIGNEIFPYDDNILVTTISGVFSLNEASGSFKKINKFDPYFSDKVIFGFSELKDKAEYISWLRKDNVVVKGYLNEEGMLINKPFLKVKGVTGYSAWWQNESNLWMSAEAKGILHYDATIPFISERFQTLIRSVKITKRKDSLIYGGVGQCPEMVLSYDHNALKIEYAAHFFDGSESTNYRYKLLGAEEQWSEWSSSAEREFNNLNHGDYSFMVISKNIYGDLGTTATFKFTILPPWYFTHYAYTGYFVLFVLFIWAIMRLNSRRLIKEKKVLEQVVIERTEEINEQKNSIEKQAKKLQALDKVKSRFFANISHELRTPITLINGPINAMLKGEYGEVNKTLMDGLNVVQNNGRSLSTLVNEILDLTRLEAGKLKLTENPVQLYSFMMELLAAYRSETKSREIDLEIDFRYGKEVSILLDEMKFSKIINNLLSNAFKFTPDQGKIILTLKEVEEDLSISIQDNGLGIHPDDIDNVFERFYQSEQPESKAQGGTGIGLALSQELAKLHHGAISVASELGKGSNFTFTFPPKVIVSSPTKIIEEEINVGIIKTNLEATVSKYIDVFEIDKPVLLLTEDHKEMRDFINQIVEPYFSVLQTSNGMEALSMLKSNRVDMIIADVMMPKMDGFELLEKIKHDESLMYISMIMLTARAAAEDKMFALTLGVDDYLTKPFNSEELLVRVKNILDNRIVRKLSADETAPASENLPNVEVAFVNNLKTLIESNISDSLLSVTYLASHVALSERQLLRKIKSLTGYSPIQFIKEVKLQRAKKLLEGNQVATVSDASYRVGIDKVDYFSSQYVSRFGKRPSDSLSS